MDNYKIDPALVEASQRVKACVEAIEAFGLSMAKSLDAAARGVGEAYLAAAASRLAPDGTQSEKDDQSTGDKSQNG